MPKEPKSKHGPLHGVRVVDLTAIVMGPYATQILADMGADIVKIEPPEGDMYRNIAPFRNPGMGSSFLYLNRNKRSIALDLKAEADRQVLFDLLGKADVLAHSLRPKSMAKLGLDYETLRQRFPKLIYCGMYGFSESGPYAGRPALDDIIQAMSGLAALQGANDADGPKYVRTIIADKVAGLAGAGAIAMALYERERSGLGQEIEVPMFETLVSFSLVEHLAGETFRPAIAPMGHVRALAPDRRPYRTKDGYLALLPYTTEQWIRFFRVVGETRMEHDPRVTDSSLRSRHVGELYRILSGLVAQRTTAEWVELLKDSDIPMTPVRPLEAVLEDEHLRASGFFREENHPTEGPIRSTSVPIKFSRTPGSVRSHAPCLNEHRAQILAEAKPAKKKAPRKNLS